MNTPSRTHMTARAEARTRPEAPCSVGGSVCGSVLRSVYGSERASVQCSCARLHPAAPKRGSIARLRSEAPFRSSDPRLRSAAPFSGERGCMGTRMHGKADAPERGCKGTRTHESTAAREIGRTGNRTHGNADARERGRTGTRGCTGTRKGMRSLFTKSETGILL